MEKRYQIFVSSTFADLKDERQAIIQTLMSMDCIPAGMELFPAADEDQLSFIKKVIDDCDYYLLLIGGRYGTIAGDGVSYTEKEYDYAIEKGMKVIALIHENPDAIPVGKSEVDSEAASKLTAFRAKARKGRLVSFWKSASDLPGKVALAVIHAMKSYPAIGWVRANSVASNEILLQINDLRKQNDALVAEIGELRADADKPMDGVAELDETFEMNVSSVSNQARSWWKCDISWQVIFSDIAPYLLGFPYEAAVKELIVNAAVVHAGKQMSSGHILHDQDFQTIKLQLIAQRLVEVKYQDSSDGKPGLFWYLTPHGSDLMMQLRVIRTAQANRT